MSDPISFTSSSPRYSLPNLFSGQAQKEFYVNEAHALTDALLHPSVVAEVDAPPASPNDGDAWLVGTSPTAEWSGHTGELASWQSGQWLYISPLPGLRIQDLSSGGSLYFDGNWQRPVAPTAPSGGSNIDTEARAAIVNLIETLRMAGHFPAT